VERNLQPAHVGLTHALRQLLDQYNMQTWQFAYVLDVNIATAHKWLNGMPVAAQYLEAICFQFNLSFTDLIRLQRSLEAAAAARRLRQDDASPVPASCDRSAEAIRERLAAAGMTPLARGRKMSVQYYCLSCARGLGPDGRVIRTRQVLSPDDRACHYCHGSILAEECLTGTVDSNPRRVA